MKLSDGREKLLHLNGKKRGSVSHSQHPRDWCQKDIRLDVPESKRRREEGK